MVEAEAKFKYYCFKQQQPANQ